MIQSEFSAAINQLASERGVSTEKVIETIKSAMMSAYRKEYPDENVEGVEVDIDPESGETKLIREEEDITPPGFGRIAAQTAKQVILQRINEAEKEAVVDEFKEKEGAIVSGTIFRVDKGMVVVDLGKAHGLMPPPEQIPSEHYRVGSRVRALLKEVKDEERNSEIILSRTDPRFVEELFALEVPEITSGTVVIEGIAREAGLRTKIAVSSTDEKIDPVGSCVGQKGVRVQAIMDELGDERIDIIPYHEEISKYISNALSPAQVREVEVDEENEEAVVEVADDQLSLAIGKGGQNVRLAAKLTGWKIDVKGADQVFGEEDSSLEGLGLSTRVENVLKEQEISIKELNEMEMGEIKEIEGIGPKSAEEIGEKLSEFSQIEEDDSVEETEEVEEEEAVQEIESEDVEEETEDMEDEDLENEDEDSAEEVESTEETESS